MERTVVGILLAHPASWPDTRTKKVVDWLKTSVKKQSTSEHKLIPNIHSARAEWFRTYTQGCDLKDWIRNILTCNSPVLGTRKYRMVVVPGVSCGPITAQIISAALAMPHLKVKAMVGGKKGPVLRDVLGIICRDDTDETSGWGLTIKT